MSLHELVFVVFYLGLLPTVLISPFAGVLIYYWLDWLPPNEVYMDTLLPANLSFIIGALTFLLWLFREKKAVPRAPAIMALMAAILIWINLTAYNAAAPAFVAFEWDRTVKVVGFAILTAQMLSTRARIEAFVWIFVLAAAYFAVPGAIKVIISGGSGGIGTGDVVVGANGSFFGDRVTLSVVLGITLPFALYLRRQPIMLPARWQRWARLAMLGVAASFLIASIGTFARTAVFASGAALLMLGVRARRKFAAFGGVAVTILVLLVIAPENWFARMNLINAYQTDASAMSRLSAWKWAWHYGLNHPIFGGGFGVFHLDAGSIFGRPGWLEAHNIFFQMLAEQGFVGLGLFVALLIATYRSGAVVQKRVRGRTDLAWAADLGRAVQIGIVAYIAGGMFVSIATTPFPFILAAIVVGTRDVVARELAVPARRRGAAAAPAAALPAA
jgi:probable O-glycosylation ligase (exosortase A-associated)